MLPWPCTHVTELPGRIAGHITTATVLNRIKLKSDEFLFQVTREEMAAAKHHVIDFLDPMEKCTVVDFRNKARH